MKKVLLNTVYHDGGNRGYELLAHPDLPLTELSNGLVMVYGSVLCKGGYKFTVQRQPHREMLHLTVSPHTRLLDVQFAHYTRVRALLEDGLIPQSLPEHDIWQPGDEDKVIAIPGHTRMDSSRKVILGRPGGGGTIIGWPAMNGDITVAELAYGMGDATITYFVRGASTHWVQLSNKYSQYKFDTGVPEKDTHVLFFGNEPTYPVDGKVALLMSSKN